MSNTLLSSLKSKRIFLDFLEKQRIDINDISFLSGDCSPRQYYRAVGPSNSFILMIDPSVSNMDRFIQTTSLLREKDFRVPLIHHSLEVSSHGILLLEDFGNTRLFHQLGKPYEEDLYLKATDILAQLHKKYVVKPENIPLFDGEKISSEIRTLLFEWYATYTLGKPLSSNIADLFIKTLMDVYRDLPPLPPTLVLIDYHIDNLMVLENKELGLLDYQDARWGSPAYDMITLLRDDRYNVPFPIQQECIDLYFEKTDYAPLLWWKNAEFFALQRHLKNLGIFARMYLRHGKNEYLAHIPRLWGYIVEECKQPHLSCLQGLLDEIFPISHR